MDAAKGARARGVDPCFPQLQRTGEGSQMTYRWDADYFQRRKCS